MRFPPTTGIQEAKQFVLASEFAPDAKVVWFWRLETCPQMLVYSKTVDPTGDVAAVVDFASGERQAARTARGTWDALIVDIPLSARGKGLTSSRPPAAG
jgi:hypothetical protein